MRRWLSGENSIPLNVASEIRQLLLKRLGQMGGLIGYSINPSTRTMLHHQTGAWFQFDDDRNITLLNPELLDSDFVPLIRFGAEEALRRYFEHDPAMAHTWGDLSGKGQSNMQIEVEYRGCVITYPRVRFDFSGWTINLSSNDPHLFDRLGGQTVIIKSSCEPRRRHYRRKAARRSDHIRRLRCPTRLQIFKSSTRSSD